jgi:hypothetical protein
MEENKIWSYKNKYKTFEITAKEIEKGMLILYPKGILQKDEAEKLFDFFIKYTRKKKMKIKLLVDNSEIKAIDKCAREYVVVFVKNESPIDKAVTFGTNYFIANFISLFVAIMCKMKIIHRAFKNKNDAIMWLKNE